MTPILEVVTKYCSIYVDDVRLSDMSRTNPPLYAHNMWQYLNAAIPFFEHPTDELEARLLGTEDKPLLVEPTYTNTQYEADEEHTEPFTVNLGEEYIGYEAFHCNKRVKDKIGHYITISVQAEYDSATGDVIIPASEDMPVREGDIFDFDMYKDGYFVNRLDFDEKKILGLLFNVAWDLRFSQDWLSRVSKVEDKSFYEQNRANKQNSDTERFEQSMQTARQEMQTYENKLHIQKINRKRWR